MPSNQSTKSPRMTPEERTRRRNQIIFLVLSAVLILAMLLSLVRL
jgi:hypothetical protein